jgi:hypothetical protein
VALPVLHLLLTRAFLLLGDWYPGVQHWADGLGTAYFALLAPIAMGCITVAILRTRALPRWTGYVFLIATVLLLGQYAVFRGALPFPQFLAFIAIGVAALVHRTPAVTPPSRLAWASAQYELAGVVVIWRRLGRQVTWGSAAWGSAAWGSAAPGDGRRCHHRGREGGRQADQDRQGYQRAIKELHTRPPAIVYGVY